MKWRFWNLDYFLRFFRCSVRQPNEKKGWCSLIVASLLAGFWGCGLVQVFSPPEVKAAFTFQTIQVRARQLAKEPYHDPKGQVPEFLLKIDYDSWRDIRFRPEKALWKKEKVLFNVQLFHPGSLYNRTVKINIVDRLGIKPLPLSTDLFNYGKNDFKDRIPAGLGFAGFRLHYPVNTKDYYDEVAVFLGASYLRGVAQKQQYGMSARGLAIDTGLSHGEEFPYFKEFWIVKPAPNATEITVYALLDSESVTGAYRYVIKPGKETVMGVKSTLFKRKDIDKLGIAPLTSMFFYAENTNCRLSDDFRPEVHESDGLMIAFRSGEWLWRPIQNPRMLQINSFDAPKPVGFGLLQRDQDFNNYQDLETRYELRPSVWVTPHGKWGEGHVELIQIPSDTEINDNIIAFWVPAGQPGKGEPISYSYTMSWHFPNGIRPPGGHVVSTRTAKGRDERSKKFIIDFAGGYLESLPPDKPLTGMVTVDHRTRLIEQQLFKNRVTQGWRLVFQILLEKPGTMDKILPFKNAPLELRAFLKEGENVI
ncbi:MAG: glucan biosynthesis protein, partial [Pseudomonadota bacterium]